jgi:hypothetical protein
MTERAKSTAGVGTIVKVLSPLRENPAGRIEVRVIELRGERRLDVRQFVESDNFSGFTRRGVCLSGEEFDALLAQAGAIRVALAGDTGAGRDLAGARRSPRGRSAGSPGSSAATASGVRE